MALRVMPVKDDTAAATPAAGLRPVARSSAASKSVASTASMGLRLAAKRCGDSHVGDEVGEEDQSEESSGWYAWRKRLSIGACSRPHNSARESRESEFGSQLQPTLEFGAIGGTSEAAAVRLFPSRIDAQSTRGGVALCCSIPLLLADQLRL